MMTNHVIKRMSKNQKYLCDIKVTSKKTLTTNYD
jgi:hypothetical protein